MQNKIKKFAKSPSINHIEVIPQLVEKHNVLAKTFHTSIEQLSGMLESVRREIDNTNTKNTQLETKLKGLIFHVNKSNVENEVLRTILKTTTIDFSRYKYTVDEIMKQDLGVDSDLKPVGTFTIN